MMRNVNVNELKNQQSCQTSVSKSAFKFRAWITTDVDDEDNDIKSMTYDLAFTQSAPINELLKREDYLMQFTGLIDKNGKEIYQEDIIKEWIEDSALEENGFWWYGIVRFLNGQWKVLQSDFEDRDYDDMHKLYEDFEILEVVGNSYENPEMLTVGFQAVC